MKPVSVCTLKFFIAVGLSLTAFEIAGAQGVFPLQTETREVQLTNERAEERENMKHISLISTGGTIAMRRDPETGGLVPSLSGEELARAAGVSETADVTAIEFSNIPSEYMTPPMMLSLSHAVEDTAENADGIVITHGTDTMEETAYFLSLVLKTDKPVVMTGAMKGASEPDADGPANLSLAMRAAQDKEAAGRGVLVAMNGKIFDARHVAKKHTTSIDAFSAGEFGPVALEEDGRISWKKKEIKRGYLTPTSMESRVWIVTCGAGTDGDIIRAAIREKVDGIIIEALGCGNVPKSIARAAQEALSAGIPVIITARVGEGSVAAEYDGEGGLSALLLAGAVSGGSLSGHKARILLMTALSSGKTPQEISEIFQKES